MSVQEKEFEKKYSLHPFYCVYQPLVDILSGEIFGYEALTRGRGRSRLPEELYRRSYEEGLTIALNLECFQMAFCVLPKMDKDRLLFVNIEPVTLARCFGPDRELNYLILNKIPQYRRRQIVFELTEGMKVRDFNYVKRGVHFLRKLGCKFAIDDVVGIGAKLFKLLTLKPDFIKIGMGLIKNIDESEIQQNLAQQLIILSNKCGASVVAEGVERKKELVKVREMGIPYVQGFYYSRPKKTLLKNIKKR